jgi:hypothetical protein
MCIDSQTSLASFIIGELSGLLLISSGEKEKQMIGMFIMFYTLVQLFEYNIYTNKNVSLNSKLLLLNLVSQGLILFALIKNICDISNIYIYIGIFIIICVIFLMFYKKHNTASIDKCIEWNFLDNIHQILLHIMYLSIFHLLFFNKCIYNNDFLRKSGYFFLTTCIISYIVSYYRPNSPSIWCMSSAILAPALLLI